MKLNITIRGETYQIDEHGCFMGGPNNVTPTCINGHEWLFLGVSTHWKQNYIVHNYQSILQTPQLAIGGYLWDLDHGTTRLWGGRYNGKLPRITNCSVSE